MMAHAYKCRCHIAMPDDAAQEKGAMLEALGECCPKGSRSLSTAAHHVTAQACRNLMVMTKQQLYEQLGAVLCLHADMHH